MDRKKFSRFLSLSRWCGLALAIPFIFGCAIHKPPGYGSDAVTAVCGASNGDTLSVSHMGETRLVTVNLVNSWDELNTHCGVTGGACVYPGRSSVMDRLYKYCMNSGGECTEIKAKAVSRIYMLEGGNCLHLASHELGHVFDVPGLDRRMVASRH